MVEVIEIISEGQGLIDITETIAERVRRQGIRTDYRTLGYFMTIGVFCS
jgi:hypothetical protein